MRWDHLIAEMESALTAFSSGRVIQPVRNLITIEEGSGILGSCPLQEQAARELEARLLAAPTQD